MARLPQPPMDKTNESLHRSLTDLISFNREIFDNGSKHAAFTQAQIDGFTNLSFLGTILFNSDTGESNIAYLDGSSVSWRAL